MDSLPLACPAHAYRLSTTIIVVVFIRTCIFTMHGLRTFFMMFVEFTDLLVVSPTCIFTGAFGIYPSKFTLLVFLSGNETSCLVDSLTTSCS